MQRYEALAADEGAGELAGTVVMGALVSALMGAFADALWAIRQEHPRLEVKLFAGQSSAFAEKVLHGELDAAVVMKSPRPLPSSMVWTQLYSEPMVLIVPRRPHFPLADRAAGDPCAKRPTSASTAKPGPATWSSGSCGAPASPCTMRWS